MTARRKGPRLVPPEEPCRRPPQRAVDDQDHWRLRRPIDFPADYWQVDALVRTLAELARSTSSTDYDPEEVGLDSPRGRMVVELEDGTKKELRIGSEVPGSGNVIVAVDGEPGPRSSLARSGRAWRRTGPPGATRTCSRPSARASLR